METVPLAASGVQLFLPKESDLIWSTVVLIILLLAFSKYIMPKFNKVMDERSARIQGRMDEAEKAQNEAMEAKRKYEERLADAQTDAANIRENARNEAARITKEARSRAESNAERITMNAQQEIETQRRQALNSLKNEVGSLATSLAGKIIGEKLDDDGVQSAMIDSLISGVESDDADADSTGTAE